MAKDESNQPAEDNQGQHVDQQAEIESKRRLQRYDIDEAYHRMLSTLFEKGEYTKSTEELEIGMLKSFYKSDNLTRTFIVPLATSDKKFFFLSVAWQKEPDDLEDAKITIKSIANNIKNILKKDI